MNTNFRLARLNGMVVTLAATAFLFLLSPQMVDRASAAPWWQESVNVESKVGTDRSIQSLDLMLPVHHTEDSLTFLDLRGRIDDQDSLEWNLGLGQRFVSRNPLDEVVPGLGMSQEAVFGYYGFADRLKSRYDNYFNQATVGAEYFTENYSLRINGYLPEDTRKRTTTFTQLQTTGTQIFFEDRQNYERPLPGYDAELGRTFRFDGWQLYGRGSYFRFHHSDVAEIEGSRFRTGVQIPGSTFASDWSDASQLTIGVEWQNDSVREEQTFGIARVSVPFGSSVESRGSGVQSQKTPENSDSRSTTPDSGLTTDSRLSAWKKDRLTERIERDVDVVTGQSDRSSPTGDTQAAELATTGETLTNVGLVRAGASGRGTLEKPAGDLFTALDLVGPGGTVFLLGNSGEAIETSGVWLREGQKLVGGHLPVIRPSDDSSDGSPARPLARGESRPELHNVSSDETIRFVTGTSGQVVRGMRITGGAEGIRGDRVSDVTVRDVTVWNNSGASVEFNRVSDATIENSNFAGAVDVGDQFEGRVVSSRAESLEVGDTASGRIKDVIVREGVKIGDDAGRGPADSFSIDDLTVYSGGLEVGSDAGRGSGNRFELRRVEVWSGDVRVGNNAGAVDGELRMDTVTVTNGFLDLGDDAGGDPTHSDAGGTVALTSITTGDTLSVGNEAGRYGGSFTMSDVTAGDGLTVGVNAGRNTGSFEMSDVKVKSGNLEVGYSAGAVNGRLRMDSVTVKKGLLDLGDDAGGDPTLSDAGGTVALTDITTGDTLSVGNEAAGGQGSLEIRSSVIESGDLAFGDKAARNNGSVLLEENELLDGSITFVAVSEPGGLNCEDNTVPNGETIYNSCN